MDSYIVRVYRRYQGSSGDEVAGMIEEVGTDQKISFQNTSSLMKTIRNVIGKDVPCQADVHELFPENVKL